MCMMYALAVCGFKTSIHTNMRQKAIAKIERSKGNPQNYTNLYCY